MKNEAAFKEIYHRAMEAGSAAVRGLEVPAMVVAEHANPLNDNSLIKRAWVVEGGPCGFAWINIKPANSGFAKWLVASGKARKDSYAGGVSLSVFQYGQSMMRKEAFAYAAAAALRSYGIKAYSNSRMD